MAELEKQHARHGIIAESGSPLPMAEERLV
jgi:hypothetical protein